MTNVEIQVKKIFSETFPNCDLDNYSESLGVGEVEDWDSIGNFNFLMALEAHFSLQFDIEQMSSLKDIRTIVKTIKILSS
ncbi:acyl carrier protein [bacterium]|nr:acyl carrier protein [bacterium]